MQLVREMVGFHGQAVDFEQLIRWKAGFSGQNHILWITINRNSRGAHKKMRCVTKNGTTQNWIESNNLHVVIWCILLSIKKIQQTTKCRLCKKVGNLAFALFANWL